MSDVNLDSQFNWSPIRTGMEEMRGYVSATTRNIGRDVSGMFAAGIAVTAITGALRSIVEEAHEIHATAEKFRLDSDALQTIGNTARDLGIPLETVARAMNRIELNAYKATQADNEQRKALEGLGISANDFFRLSADQKILALAGAYERSGDKATAYAQIVSIVGRRESEVMRIIELGTEAIKAQGDQAKYSAEQLAEIETARIAWVRLWHDLQIIGANFFTAVVAPIQRGMDGINKAIADVIAGGKRMFGGDFLGGLKQFFYGGGGAEEGMPPSARSLMVSPPATLEQRAAIEGEGGTGAGATTGGASAAAAKKDAEDQIKLAEKLAKIQRDAGFARLSDGGKLEVLQREQAALQATELTQESGTTDQLETQVAIAQKQKDIDELSAKISQDDLDYQEKIAKVRQDMADKADQDLADSQEQTKELYLQLIGRKDLADRARIEYEYNTKIHDAQNAITKAEELGDDAVANTNRALVTQLSLEKQTALAAHDKARAEEMAAKAAAEKVNVEREKQNLADLKEANAELDLRLQNRAEEADLLHTNYEFDKQINEALGEANDLWDQMANAYRDGNKALGDQLAIHAQLKQAEADELEIEKQQTLELKAQQQLIDSMTRAGISQSRYADAQQGTLTRAGTGVDYINAAGNRVSIAAPATMDLSVIGGLASGNLRMGATPDVLAAAIAHFQGLSPEATARLGMQLEAESQLRRLSGRNLGWFEQLQNDKMVQAYADWQQQQASQAAALSHQQEIDYWSAIAGGRTPVGGNPYLAMFGMPNFATGQFQPLTQEQAIRSMVPVLQSQGFTLEQILKGIQQIEANTGVVVI
jgi:hypothetical protein